MPCAMMSLSTCKQQRGGTPGNAKPESHNSRGDFKSVRLTMEYNFKFEAPKGLLGNPVAAEATVISVGINANELLGDYASAFVSEAYRVNPNLANQVDLSAEEVREYVLFLLNQRIEFVSGNSKDWRALKLLWMPCFIEYNLRLIGKVEMFEEGITFVPVMDGEVKMTLEQALKVSDKIGAFRRDLQMVQDAFPRDEAGDSNVMMTAVIAGYVRSVKRVEDPVATIVSAFLGFKLREEAAFTVLYRIRYDDVDFIARAVTRMRGLFH